MFITSMIFLFITGLLALGYFTASKYLKKNPEQPEKRIGKNQYSSGTDNPEYKVWENAKDAKKVSKTAAIVTSVATLIFLFPSVFYSQDVGEARVLKDWTGNIVGTDTTQGAAFKAPWVNSEKYDIRNQQVVFASSGESIPKDANGAQITVQDKEGVSANIDITVRYSIDPTAVQSIYERYQSQQNFVSRFIENDIRAGVRTVPAAYGTLELLNNRAKVETQIRYYLEERWANAGVLIETVSLQEIRYSDEVKGRFDAAQAQRINVETEKAKLEATKVSAEQKIVEAEAASKANAKLAESLTEPILKQRYLDTLEKVGEKGNLIVVPDGFNGILNLDKKAAPAAEPAK